MFTISAVRFTPTQDPSRDSFATISDANMFSAGKATPGGPADPHLGTIISQIQCQTCKRRAGDCEGHPGVLHLRYPVYSPLFSQEVSWWLRAQCLTCGRLRLTDVQMRSLRTLPIDRRLQSTEKLADKNCPHCGEPAIIQIARETTRAGHIWFVLTQLKKQDPTTKSLPDRMRVPAHVAKALLERIPYGDVEMLGLPASSHPRWLILDKVRVPPLPSRHDFVRPDSAKKKPHDLTATLTAVIRHNLKMPPAFDLPVGPARYPFLVQLPPDQLTQTRELDDLYAAFVRGGGFRPHSRGGAIRVVHGVQDTLQKKEGFIRSNMLGKRVWAIGRSVIYCDPSLRLDEVAIPISIARGLEIPERVTADNLERLLGYFHAAPRYPGATRLIKSSSGHDHEVEALHARARGIIPEIGDWLVRPLLSGDWVLFNRQPSLEANSVLALRAVIKEDPTSLGFGMNVLTCPFFNADFDGDEMNIMGLRGTDAQVEARHLSALAEWLVSYKNSRTIAGQAQDSIIGSFLLTAADTRLTKREIVRVIARVSVPIPLDDLSPEDSISGRELVSRLLLASRLPVNFSGKSKWFNKSFQPFIRPGYHPSDQTLEIVDGKIISGVMDKETVGEGSMGLFRVLVAEYGARPTLEFIYNLQQIAIAFATVRGFSAGVDDVLLPPKDRKEVHSQLDDMRERALIALTRLRRGQLVPPLGMTVREFNEETQTKMVNLGRIHEPLLQAQPVRENGLLMMALTGARGKLAYNIALAGSVGQMKINNQRIQPIYGPRRARALPYFRNDEEAPEAYGLIVRSYIEGIDVPSFLFNAMQARVALIHKALSTAKTGWQYRKLVRSMDGVHVATTGAVQMGRIIFQPLYGGMGFDQRKVESVQLRYIVLDDASLEKEYRYRTRLGAKVEQMAAREFETITAARRRARDAFLLQQHMDPEPSQALARGQVLLCFNLRRLLATIRDQRRADLRDPATLTAREVGAMYRALDQIPELLRIQYGLKDVKAVPWLLVDAIRCELCMVNLLAPPALSPAILRQLLERIAVRVGHSLAPYGNCVGTLAAQAISEVLTQYVLDSHHRTAEGGTSKTGMNHVREIQGGKSKSSLPTSMIIPLKGPAATNQAQARVVAMRIEMMPVSRFLSAPPQILFEPRPGDVRYPPLRHEMEWIKPLLKKLPPPRGLVPAVIRLVLSRPQIIQKGLAFRDLLLSLQRAFPDAYILGTPEAASTLVVRIYPPLSALGSGRVPHHHQLQTYGQQVVDHVLRGAPGVRRAEVREIVMFVEGKNGALEKESRYQVVTEGANLRALLSDPTLADSIDGDRVGLDSIWDTARYQGIAAARQRIITEHTTTVKGVNEVHYSLVADTMVMLGFITAIEHGGIVTRDAADALLQVANQAPQRGLRMAAMHGQKCSTDSPTAAVMVGRAPTRGTYFSKVVVDEKFTRENTRSLMDLLL